MCYAKLWPAQEAAPRDSGSRPLALNLTQQLYEPLAAETRISPHERTSECRLQFGGCFPLHLNDAAFSITCVLIAWLGGGVAALSHAATRSHVIRNPQCRRAARVTAKEDSPAWYQETAQESTAATAGAEGSKAAAESATAPEPPQTPLNITDLVNTKWKVQTTHRAEGWLPGTGQQQEFTLLEDGSVVWGGQAGGFGTGGRWQVTDTTLEVIRTTPLGLVTGRDYYMSYARATVNDKLQFVIRGIIRSYNALYPVAVVADFEAVRQPGRFVRNTDEDEEGN
ncbi:hypothetical protein AB1Y20_017590 [Prymnesium parvum]|uniref:Uncharacterized protein n=1 Tax=Prymnesium parvum TaxID=97485 RepID=A0AB34JPG0_PRYPA